MTLENQPYQPEEPAHSSPPNQGTPFPSAGENVTPSNNQDVSPPNNAARTPPAVDVKELEAKIIEVLKTCFDPEIPVNIYELGLVYGIEISPTGDVNIRMTLTSPACPVAGSLPPEVEAKVNDIPGVASARVDVVWDPPWSMDKMTDAARLKLGFM